MYNLGHQWNLPILKNKFRGKTMDHKACLYYSLCALGAGSGHITHAETASLVNLEKCWLRFKDYGTRFTALSSTPETAPTK